MTRVFLGAMMLAAAPLAAQDSQLVGTWQMKFAVAMKMEGGGVVTPTMGSGTLTIAASGDSLVGTLVTDSIPGQERRPAVQMGGKPKGNEVIMMTRSKAKLNLNGNEREATAISTWTVKVAGDSLTGTVDRRIEGMSMPGVGPQPVTGSRKQS